MASSQYFIEIQNEYLGKFRRVTGRTRYEVELKASEQLQRWSEQEARARHRDAVNDAKANALDASDRARGLIEEYRSILRATLAVDDRLNWASLVDSRPFSVAPPTIDQARARHRVPAPRGMMERIRPKLREQRERAESAANDEYRRAVAEWERQRDAYEERIERQRREATAFREAYESGVPEAVEYYVSLVLSASALPDGLQRDCAVSFDAASQTLVVDAHVPSPSDLPTVTEYRYVASRDAIDEKRLKPKEVNDLYEEVLLQLALRTIHEVFEGEYAGHVGIVVSTEQSPTSIERPAGTSVRASSRFRRSETSSSRSTSPGWTRVHVFAH